MQTTRQDENISSGGKAGYLKRLEQAGFAVPPFFLVREEQADKDLAGQFGGLLRKGGLYAVRSSGALEDGEQTAMAGLYQTFLNVPASDVPEKVRLCFASAKRSRVRDFLKARGLTGDGPMTVIVQRMIRPELSGVLFTANPQGILNEMVAVLGEGTGDLVVEDQVPVTTLIHHFHDETDMVLQPEGAPAVPPQLIRDLTALCLRLKEVFGRPMDAEFAVASGKIWLLQARPITTLSAEVTVLDNSNISESYPGITLPLTVDFARTAYAGIFRGLLGRILGPRAAQELRPVLGEMVTASSGRMYYQINHWYQVMKLMPFARAYIPVWQEMMGVRHKEVEAGGFKLSTWTRLRGTARFARALRQNPGQMAQLDREFQAFRRSFEAALAEAPDRTGLEALYERMKQDLLERWDVTLINDLRAFVFTGALKRTALRGQTDPGRIISGIGEVESLRPVRLLSRIARHAPEAFLRLETAQAVHDYLDRGTPFAILLRDYIEEYGDRYLEELKLEARTFRTDPLLLVGVIKSLRREEAPGVGAANADLDHGLIYTRAAKAIRNREISRLNRTRIFGMAREIFLRLGEIHVKEGSLDDPRDIFWLNQTEAFKGRCLQERVRERKALYAAFGRLPTLSRLVFSGAPFDRTLPEGTSFTDSGSADLVGAGASAGVARGRVLLVTKPEDVASAQGRILVTRQTDPGWVFLIAGAKGLIAERGSLLSHTAIIARELKKPAVVGLKGALTLFENGEMIEIDGSTGQVRRITHESD